MITPDEAREARAEFARAEFEKIQKEIDDTLSRCTNAHTVGRRNRIPTWMIFTDDYAVETVDAAAAAYRAHWDVDISGNCMAFSEAPPRCGPGAEDPPGGCRSDQGGEVAVGPDRGGATETSPDPGRIRVARTALRADVERLLGLIRDCSELLEYGERMESTERAQRLRRVAAEILVRDRGA